MLCRILGHKTKVTITDGDGYINVIVGCIRCGKWLHDIDAPKKLRR